jgi:hypothetical protein
MAVIRTFGSFLHTSGRTKLDYLSLGETLNLADELALSLLELRRTPASIPEESNGFLHV